MLTVLGIVLFALVILFSIALHEVGHLMPAKRFGVKVTQYMVGFGPTMWSRRRGETEYGVKWIPFGGYIRMIGMFPPRPGDLAGSLRRSSTGPFQAMMEDARRASLDEIEPGDEHRVFYRLSVPKRVVVMLGGPVMNLVLAVVFLGVALSAVGVPQLSTTVDTVSECVVPASETRTECAPGDPAAPAAAAGLQPGDRLLSFDGERVTDWVSLSDDIRDQGAGPVEVVVERDGREVTLSPELISTPRPTAADDPTLVEVSFLGVSPGLARETAPVSELPGTVWNGLTRTAEAIVDVPGRMVGVWDASFGGGEREVDGPIGVVGVTRIGGEVAALEEIPLYAKVSQFLVIAGSLNMALFIFNLIPLLPLDGGHVAGALYEGARRQLNKVLHRPDPGPVDVARMLPVAYTVAILLVGMSGLLLYADVVNPIRLSDF